MNNRRRFRNGFQCIAMLVSTTQLTEWRGGFFVSVCLSIAGTMGNLARGLVSIFVVLLSVIVALVLFSGRTLLHFLINKIYRNGAFHVLYICLLFIHSFLKNAGSYVQMKIKRKKSGSLCLQKETHKIKAKQSLSLWLWSIYLH